MDDFDRARNNRTFPWLGDPERWGAHQTVHLAIPAAGSASYAADGGQMNRVQVKELLARGWDLTCAFSATGLLDSDVVAYYLKIAWGGGQNTALMQVDLVQAATINPCWRKTTTTGGVITSWGASLRVPIPGANINVSPRIEITVAGGAARSVIGAFDCFLAPRSLS